MNKIVKRNILASYICDAVLGTYFQLPIWIVYQSQFLTFNQIAFFSGLSLVTEVVMQLPTGAFADLFGRKFSLSLGNLFMALPMFLIAMYPKPEIMWLYAMSWGLGKAFCMGTSGPILFETLNRYGYKSLFPSILSKSVVVFQISAALSIVSGGYLYQISNSLPYYVSGFASLLGIFTSLLFIEERPLKHHFKIASFIQKTKSGFKEIFKNGYVTKLTMLYALTVGISLANQQFFSQPYMVEIGMTDIQRSWAAMIIKITVALTGAKLLATSRIFDTNYFLLIIPVLMVVSLSPAMFVSLPLAYAVLTGIAFSSGNSNLFISQEINENIDSTVRSTAISAQRMIASTIGASTQWLSVPIIAVQSVSTFYSYLGIFSLVAIVPIAYSVMRHKHKHSVNSNAEVLKSLIE